MPHFFLQWGPAWLTSFFFSMLSSQQPLEEESESVKLQSICQVPKGGVHLWKQYVATPVDVLSPGTCLGGGMKQRVDVAAHPSTGTWCQHPYSPATGVAVGALSAVRPLHR
uniref:Uncharacterized protein n=1 Tax=Sphaerodactylus townsendi TaxID=933632 RepID=A0ACB8F3J1_9SAUR